MINEGVLASDLDDRRWIYIGTTTSNSASWGFDRLRLYNPKWYTEVGISTGDRFLEVGTLDANQNIILNGLPDVGHKVFSTTDGFEHDFSFDLSFNTNLSVLYIYISGIPTTAEIQQIYTHPTGYGATYGRSANLSDWDFSVLNAGLNVGGVDTGMFFENQSLSDMTWRNINTTPKIYAKTLRFQNNFLGSDDLDKLLIWVNAGGQINGSLNYSGNSGVPTFASRAAYDSLVAKGWAITGTAPPTS